MRGSTNSLPCSGQWWLRYCVWYLTLAMTFGSPESTSSKNITNYLTHRSRFLANEASMSLGGKLNLDSNETVANDILMAAKRAEVDAGFQNSSRFLPAQNFLIPSVVDEIRLTKTFQIIQKMPKGAVLHAHDISIASSDFVYENITFRDDLHVCRPEDGSIGFRFLRSSHNDTTCTSPAGWELLADLRKNETIAEVVNNQIRSVLKIALPDSAVAFSDVDAAWVDATVVFGSLMQLLTYLPVFADYYYQGLTEMHEDNVMYIEIRAIFPTLYDLDGKTYEPLDVAQLYKNTTDRFVNDHPDFVGAKLIYTPLRSASTKTFDEYLVNLYALRKEFPEFVAGFDLAGQEDKGEPLVRFADKLQTLSPSIKLFFHAGETKWGGTSTDENLIDAVLLNTTRIGHGYALEKHPRVLDIVMKRGVAIEVNPISSQAGTLASDMRSHTASFLFARDFPVVVSCDDPGIWGAVGLSYDFYEAFVGIMSRSADIRALKQLAINSIKYSAMSENEKTRAYTIWKAKWTKFITDLIEDNKNCGTQC